MHDWVKVAAAPNETSALLMEGVLKEEGIPVLNRRRLRGPDFLSAGPKDILVAPSFVEEAKRFLEDTAELGSWA